MVKVKIWLIVLMFCLTWLLLIKSRRKSVFLLSLFYVYIFSVIYATMRPFHFQLPNTVRTFYFDIQLFYQLRHMADGYLAYQLLYSVGNVVMFIPFGFFMPLLYKKMNHWLYIVIIGFSCSLVIEIVQAAFTLTRRGTVDDLFFNTVGALLGYLLFRMGHTIYRRIILFKVSRPPFY